MQFDYKIIGILVMLMLLIIAIIIITGMSSKVGQPSQYLTMQLGLG